MKPELIKEDGRVFEVKYQIEERYLNSTYSLLNEVAVLSPQNGLLKIFSLKPIARTGPSFLGRWDGGSRDAGKTERYDLDFDICGVTQKEKYWFTHGKNGYSGHHASRVSSKVSSGENWEYEVFITTPSDTIFKGFVRLHLHHKMDFSATR